MGFFRFLNCCTAVPVDGVHGGVVESGVRSTQEIRKELKKYKLEDLKRELEALGIQPDEDRKNEKKLKRELRKVLLRELKRTELERAGNGGEVGGKDEAAEALNGALERVDPEAEKGAEEPADGGRAADLDNAEQQDGDSAANGPMKEKGQKEKVALLIDLLGDMTDRVDEVNSILSEAGCVLRLVKAAGVTNPEEKDIDQDVVAVLDDLLDKVDSTMTLTGEQQGEKDSEVVAVHSDMVAKVDSISNQATTKNHRNVEDATEVSAVLNYIPDGVDNAMNLEAEQKAERDREVKAVLSDVLAKVDCVSKQQRAREEGTAGAISVLNDLLDGVASALKLKEEKQEVISEIKTVLNNILEDVDSKLNLTTTLKGEEKEGTSVAKAVLTDLLDNVDSALKQDKGATEMAHIEPKGILDMVDTELNLIKELDVVRKEEKEKTEAMHLDGGEAAHNIKLDMELLEGEKRADVTATSVLIWLQTERRIDTCQLRFFTRIHLLVGLPLAQAGHPSVGEAAAKDKMVDKEAQEDEESVLPTEHKHKHKTRRGKRGRGAKRGAKAKETRESDHPGGQDVDNEKRKEPERQGDRAGNNVLGKDQWRPAAVDRQWRGQRFGPSGHRKQSSHQPVREDKKGERVERQRKPPTERGQRRGQEVTTPAQRHGNKQPQDMGRNRLRERDNTDWNGRMERGTRAWWNRAWEQESQAEHGWYGRDGYWYWAGPRRRPAVDRRDRGGDLQ
ncbi:uncharacterized protein LOC121677857 isoform X2 [Alosa sapidissima]|uniref:uncharacterized protein LOC121677857 isoform X2 n=1 Tax=Alosa sapidissima TaxID=34773 RepID=UPI001C09DA11|nr:uncharacterized protein LOC121677857 isoform X2 [Alosa sapidissima]